MSDQEEPYKMCYRCISMSKGKRGMDWKNKPKSGHECKVCCVYYCDNCFPIVHRGNCYICGASDSCYFHDIREVVCYECL